MCRPGIPFGHFIQKPFSRQDLMAKVREVLDEAPTSVQDGFPAADTDF
jgi:FixJ family two-component response regulator